MESSMIWLDHNQIQAFYESVKNPNIDELNRRDEFIRHISEETPYSMDGTDIVANIPDIDFHALINENDNVYTQVRDICMTIFVNQDGKNITGCSYTIESVMNVAA